MQKRSLRRCVGCVRRSGASRTCIPWVRQVRPGCAYFLWLPHSGAPLKFKCISWVYYLRHMVHHSGASLGCNTWVHHLGASLGCTTQMHHSGASLGCITQVHHSGAPLGCITWVHHSGASLGCITWVHHSGASLGCITQVHHLLGCITSSPVRVLHRWGPQLVGGLKCVDLRRGQKVRMGELPHV